jgi:hypothetical protein
MITRTPLTRAQAVLAFPRIQPALYGGQTVGQIIMCLPAGDGFDAFHLDDGTTRLAVVLSHDPKRELTTIVLLERVAGGLGGRAYALLVEAYRQGLVRAEKNVAGLATSEKYAKYVQRQFADLTIESFGDALLMRNTTDKVT